MTERSPRGPRRPDGATADEAFPGGLFAIACPACGTSLAARVRDAGRGMTCPCCGAGLLLPATPHAALAAAAALGPAVSRMPTVPEKAAVPAVHAPPQPPISPMADEEPRSVAVEQSASSAAVDGVPEPTFDAAVPTFDLPMDLLAGVPSVTAVVSEAALAVGDSAERKQADVRDRRARERRRAQRSLFMVVVGSAILLGIVFYFTGFVGRR